MNVEDAAEEVLANQLDIARQSIDDRDKRIEELQIRVQLLETMLNRLAAQRSGVPVPQAQPSYKAAPRRWTVR